MVRAACLAALSALLIAVPIATAAPSLHEPLRDRPGGFLTRPSDQRPVTIALDYVREHPRTFRLDAGDLAGLRLTRAYRSGDGTVHLQWEQVYRGIPVFGPGLRANVARDGRLVNVGEGAVPDPGVDSIKPRLPAPARDASLTLFGGKRLAWRFLRHADPTHVYDTVVDATTGETLYRANKVRSVDALVFENYPGAPVGGTQVSRDITGWLTSSTALTGPNTHVYSDEDDNIDGDPPDGSVQPADEIVPTGGNWNYAQDARAATSIGQSCPAFGCTWNSFDPVAFGPSVNRRQAGTQLFYFVNRFHDWLRDAPGIGFNSASGAHEGSDPVQAQVDDGADLSDCLNHRNNAYVLPVPDGTPMLMQVLLWSGNCPNASGFNDVNPADDAYVINHEYAHGMNNRLVTYGDGTPALNANQSWAMDEGLADWYALDYLVGHGFTSDSAAPGELRVGVYENTALRSQPFDCPVGASPAACPGAGIAGSGGYTYGDFARICCGGFEPHADGEIWVETLWDLRTRLIAAHPADGLTRARALVTDGLRLVRSDPSFLDMRDAILTVNTLRGYGDSALIWSVFAARGMGANATTNGPNDTAPHQDFTVPSPPPRPPGPPPADLTRPTLKSVSMLRKRFKAGARSAFKFTLSELATVKIGIARAEQGRRSRARCRPATRKLRKRPRCTRYVSKGSLLRTNMSRGAHSVAFRGKLRGRALKPGRYRAIIRATDPTGNRSRTATLSFTIIRR